jgi:hypothetical protein
MPGGNTSSRKKPYRTLKDSAAAYDNHALAGGRFFGETMSGNQEAYIDQEVGLPYEGPTNATPGNVDGNAGFNGVNAGPGVVVDRSPKRSGNDPTPGGGW